MAVISLVIHPVRPDALAQAQMTVDWLIERGHTVRLSRTDAQRLNRPDLGIDDHDLGFDADLAVSLGGDGTMLHAVGLVADHEVPVLGVNFGRLGYLTEVEATDARRSIERFLSGDHTIEERMRVTVKLEDSEGNLEVVGTVINEAVLEKDETGRAVHLAVSVGGEHFSTYVADALIVATPTGSTAYSLSAGGPILEPTHRALVLTPVAPHMLFDRSLVLEPASTVRLEVIADRCAMLTLDGRPVAKLSHGAAMICSQSSLPARLVTFGERDFHQILKHKFGLNDR